MPKEFLENGFFPHWEVDCQRQIKYLYLMVKENQLNHVLQITSRKVNRMNTQNHLVFINFWEKRHWKLTVPQKQNNEVTMTLKVKRLRKHLH